MKTYLIGLGLGILITIMPAYNMGHLHGYQTGLKDGREIWEKLPQEIKLMCYTDHNTWDRCRQKDGSFYDASGKSSSLVRGMIQQTF